MVLQVVALFQELRNFLSDSGMMDANFAEPGDASANGLSTHPSGDSDDPSFRTNAASKVSLLLFWSASECFAFMLC